MKRLQILLVWATVLIAVLGFAVWRTQRQAAPAPLPFRDDFAHDNVSGWQPFGGAWRLRGDSIIVNSAESGPKLAIGSDRWADYQVWTDVQLLGHDGFVGLAVRATDLAQDPDALSGYVVLLRSPDAGLEITRASHVWLSNEPSHLAGGVKPNRWYRLHVVVAGCHIAAEATDTLSGKVAYSGFVDAPAQCLRHGRVVLYTTATTAAWRHVLIETTNLAGYNSLAGHLQHSEKPAFPKREREYTKMREDYLSRVPLREQSAPDDLGGFGDTQHLDAAPLISISALNSRLWDTRPLRIAGVVTSIDPLYLQDATGGVRTLADPQIHFNLGDEVEMAGTARREELALRFQPFSGLFLSDRVSAPAVSINAAQAASGAYEGLFVELNGVLRHTQVLPDGDLDLTLVDAGQTYAVHMPYELFHAASGSFERNATLRVLGVCSNTRNTMNAAGVSFTVYAASSADVTQLAPPPWWTGQRLVWSICGGVLLLGGAIVLYGIAERSRLRAVQDERERLSQDMHDTLAQSLAGVGFRLQGIYRSLREAESVPRVHVDELKQTADLVAQTHREASASIAALHPSSQTDGDLLQRLERAVNSIIEDREFPLIVSSHGAERPLSPFVADTLYRVGREAIANAFRHAQAQSIRVQLVFRPREVVLSITDDGIGFAFEPSRAGFGVRTMIQRCEVIHASIDFLPAPNSGCRVQITSPYRLHRGLIRWVG